MAQDKRIAPRRNTTAGASASNPVLDDGEMGVETDGTRGIKFGDGVTAWNDLPYWGGSSSTLFLGTYTSLVNLTIAHPDPEDGSTANIDEGVGEDVRRALWDNDDDVWVLGGVVPAENVVTRQLDLNVDFTSNKQHYLNTDNDFFTVGDIVLSDVGSVEGMFSSVFVSGYEPNITGADYIIANNSSNGQKDVYNFSKDFDSIKLDIVGLSVLTTPVVTLTPSDEEILIDWTISVGATEYEVLRNTTNTVVGATSIYTGSLNTFNDTGLTNGTDYYYFLQAKDRQGYIDSDYGTNNDQPEAYPSTAFVFNVQTDNVGTSSDLQFKVPTFVSGTGQISEYNCTVDWGDGNVETGFTTYNDARWTHTYSATGSYRVIVTGVFKGFGFANGGDKEKLLSFEQFGLMSFGNFNAGGNLRGCTNLVFTATDSPDATDTVELGTFFMGCNFSTIPSINSWGLQPTAMSNTFRDCVNFNQDLTGIDTSLCTTFNATFRGCTVFNGSIIGWSGDSCLNVQQMFDSAIAFNQPVDHLVLESCTTFALWFTNADLFDQSLANIKPVAVTSAVSMFNAGSSLSTANYTATLIGWDSHVETLASINYDFDISTYNSTAVTPKANLVGDGLTFTDGGLV